MYLKSYCRLFFLWTDIEDGPIGWYSYSFCWTSNTSTFQHATHGARIFGTQCKHTDTDTFLHGGHVTDKSRASLRVTDVATFKSFRPKVHIKTTALWNDSFLWTTWPPPLLTPKHFQHKTSLILHGKGIKLSYSKNIHFYENKDTLGKIWKNIIYKIRKICIKLFIRKNILLHCISYVKNKNCKRKIAI
jgi:hypothetical protein